MNCFNHPETPAVAYCRTCGKALCEACRRPAVGTVFCDEHLPAAAGVSPGAPAEPAQPSYQSTAPNALLHDVSPGLACFLGFIPGVGAIYNGQYAKGLVHAIVFGLLVSINHSGAAEGLEPLFGMLTAAFVFYMALEAYHTAQKRRMGVPVDEFSSLVNLRGRPGTFPIGAIVLIVVGVILLLNTMDFLSLRYLLRYWPALLILIGLWMLYERLTSDNAGAPEVRHER